MQRSDPEGRNLAGMLNRRLHLEEILYYKAAGYSEYDFGGIWPDPENPHYPIGQFKLSFGGDTKKLHNFLLIKNTLVRKLWRTARWLKHRTYDSRWAARG